MIKIGDKFRCVSSPQKSIEAGDIVEVQSRYEGYDKYYCYYVKNLTNGTAVPSRTYLDKNYEPFKYKAGDKYLGSLNELKPLTFEEAEKLNEGDLIVYLKDDIFKSGEVVKCSLDNRPGGKPCDRWFVRITSGENIDGTVPSNLALLPEEENNMSELEELVKIANAGLNAFVEIEKSHKESITWGEGTGINWSDGTTMGLILLAAGHNKGIRIKPEKPKFEEFTTKEGWLVKVLDNGLLQIGCRKDYDVEST